MTSEHHTFEELIAIMKRLRGPGGCPWDAEQTHESLTRYLLEETYEVIEAIEAKSPEHIKEELGDLLLQPVFHAAIAEEALENDARMIFSGIWSGLIPPRYGVDKETVAGIARTLRGDIHINLERSELAACADLTRGKLIRGGS